MSRAFFIVRKPLNTLVYHNQVNMLNKFNHDKTLHIIELTFTTLWANSADDQLVYIFLFFFSPEDRLWHFMQIVSLHEMPKSSSTENKKKKKDIFKMSSVVILTQHAKR